MYTHHVKKMQDYGKCVCVMQSDGKEDDDEMFI